MSKRISSIASSKVLGLKLILEISGFILDASHDNNCRPSSPHPSPPAKKRGRRGGFLSYACERLPSFFNSNKKLDCHAQTLRSLAIEMWVMIWTRPMFSDYWRYCRSGFDLSSANGTLGSGEEYYLGLAADDSCGWLYGGFDMGDTGIVALAGLLFNSFWRALISLSDILGLHLRCFYFQRFIKHIFR